MQKKPFRTHRSDIYIEYNSLPINHLFSHNILLLMYKCIYTKQLLPSLFQNYMFPNKNIHSHDTRTKNLLHLTQVNSSFGSRAINDLGAKLWNTLPASISNATSFFTFKAMIKKFLTAELSNTYLRGVPSSSQ